MVNRKAVNLWTARVIPLFLFAVYTYGSYVVIAQVGVIYFLAPQQNGFTHLQRRTGPAIAIIVIFSVVILLVVVTYCRLLLTIALDVGFVPRSRAYDDYQSQLRRRGGQSKQSKNPSGRERDAAAVEGSAYEQSISTARPSPANEQPGLSTFYNKDVFVCEGDGRPPWCSVCLAWKPDRAHHCRECQRCVRKMDHFCPWVGGVVSEANFKFFIQFNSYVVMVCVLAGIVVAYSLAEQIRDGISPSAHLPAGLAMVSLFGLFCGGMVFLSGGYALRNLTSIEVLNHRTKVWTMAVYLPHPPPPNAHPPYQTITFPLTIDPSAKASPPQRTFAILHSQPGENPFDLGKFGNWKSVMGETIWEWLLPLHYSPCFHHPDESDFALGPAFDRMKQRAGLARTSVASEIEPPHRRRRRGARRSVGVGVKSKDSQEVHLQKQTPEPDEISAVVVDDISAKDGMGHQDVASAESPAPLPLHSMNEKQSTSGEASRSEESREGD